MLAPITPVNAMASAFKLTYRAAKGKQKPEHLEGQANDVLEAVALRGPPRAGRPLDRGDHQHREAIRYGNAVTGEEALEINTVV